MPVKIRIQLDSPNIKKFLQTDQGIHDDLERRADAVKDEADSKMVGRPAGNAEEHHSAEVWVGADRQRATVRTVSWQARVREADEHTLLSSLDAARSP